MKKRVLYLCPFTGIGGIETFIQHTHLYIDTNQFENHYLVFRAGPVADRLRATGAQVHLLDQPPTLFHWPDHKKLNQVLRNLINEKSIDLVFSLGSKGALFACTASKQLKRPHIWFQYHPRGGSDRLAALAYHQGLVVSSHHASHEQRRLENPIRFLIPRTHPIEKILLGTDLKPLPTEAVQAQRQKVIQELGLPHSEDLCLISLLGQIHPRKGLLTFLKALNELKKRELNWPFFALLWGPSEGQESHRQELQNFIDENKLPARLMGLSESVPLSYGISDFYVNSSVQPEAFSHAMIEAMALGLPAIVPDAGALPEVITNGYNGLIFPTADPLALADRMRRLIEDPVLRHKLSQGAKETVESRHDSRKTMEHLQQFFHRILDDFH